MSELTAIELSEIARLQRMYKRFYYADKVIGLLPDEILFDPDTFVNVIKMCELSFIVEAPNFGEYEGQYPCSLIAFYKDVQIISVLEFSEMLIACDALGVSL